MSKRMLIDASHMEESRVAILSNDRLDEFDYETTTKKQLKGNIYLAKVIRVEPSLQAAFVEFGGNKHGFLAFNEIHPDYYRLPMEDRERLAAQTLNESHQIDEEIEEDIPSNDEIEILGGEDVDDLQERAQRVRPPRHYKIQEVLKRRQIMLVQVVKEERGGKGAALTTYLSLPGRYCVLMPNAVKGGGISRKITNVADRKRLRTIIESLNLPETISLIIRTAGMARSKVEIKRDCDYLMQLWNEIRDKTLHSMAPALIYEESDLIKRAIRDYYTRDIEEVWIEGEAGFKEAKDFIRKLMPSHIRKIKEYTDERIPLFYRYGVEQQIDAMHGPTVQLKSGGSIVFGTTEALVAIDVNSGKATRERHIEETAYKTNLEAADEIARQLRLRDLAGLIVIDFIDMEVNRNVEAVERRLKDAMRHDRARVQVGRISVFGLLELSRQRLRPNIIESTSLPCHSCRGTGMVRSVESSTLHVLRAIEEEAIEQKATEFMLTVPTAISLYILNQKRKLLQDLEARWNISVRFSQDDTLIPPDYRLERLHLREKPEPVKKPAVVSSPEIQIQTVEGEIEGEAGTGTGTGVETEKTSPSKPRRRYRKFDRRAPRPQGASSEHQHSLPLEHSPQVSQPPMERPLSERTHAIKAEKRVPIAERKKSEPRKGWWQRLLE
ncbi:MAG: ribonuclease E/G [Alphaproteobacteria bacterium]|nr:ribonuclease E/G [Alphaproteobacteria bacterium]